MMKKLIKKYIFVMQLILFASLNASQVSFKLEHVNVNRIDILAEKYSNQFSHAKKMKILKYSALGISAAAIIGLVVWDSYFRQQPNGEVKKTDLDRDKYYTSKRKKSLWGIFINDIEKGVALGVSGILLKVLWDFVGAGSNAVQGLFNSGNISDVSTYHEKQIKIRETLLKLAKLPELSGKQELPSVENKVFFEIALSDVILTHKTMICLIEDMLAFIKFLMILGYGKESYEYASATGYCTIIASKFNEASDKMTLIVNQDQKVDKQAFISDFAIFCRKFTKFICDSGVSLYGQDFLQK